MGRWRLRRDRQCSQDIFSKAPLQTGSDKKGVVAVSKRVGERHTPFRHQMEVPDYCKLQDYLLASVESKASATV